MSGFGVGIYKGGREMENTPFAEEYDWYIQGTSPYIMHMILQLGILGTLWFIVFFFSLFFRKPKLFPLPDRNVHLYFLAIFFIMLFYADLWKESMFCIGIFTFMFLSWKPSYGKIAESQDSTEQVLLHEKIIT